MELNTLLASVRRWWSLILIGTILAALAGLGFALTSSAQYRSEVQILVGPVNAPLDTVRASSLLVQSYAEISTSSGFLSDVLVRANSSSTPEEVADQIDALANDTTRVLSIGVTAATPNEAAIIANSIASELLLIAQESGLDEGQMLVLSRAEVPDSAESQPLLLLTILSGMAGAMVMAAVATLLDHLPWRATAIDARASDDIPWLHGQVLGLIPRRKPRRARDSEPTTRRVATRALLATVHKGSRSVLFSACGTESTQHPKFVAEFCVELLKTAQNLLVVDLSAGGAVSDILRGAESFQLESDSPDRLWGDLPLLALGNGDRTIHLVDRDARELGVETVAELSGLRSDEDFVFENVILYTTNPLEDVRTSLLAASADSTVLLSSDDGESIDELRECLSLFGDSGANIGGVVMLTKGPPTRSVFNLPGYQIAPLPRDNTMGADAPTPLPDDDRPPRPVVAPGVPSLLPEGRRSGES